MVDRDRTVRLSKRCDQYLAAGHLRVEALKLMPLAQGQLSRKFYDFAEMVLRRMKCRAYVPDNKNDYMILER
jgi:hypothetical protein